MTPTDVDLDLHDRSLRLYKGLVHAWELYALHPEHATFLPIAGHLRGAADEWAAWLRQTREAHGPALPSRRSIP